MKILLSSLAMKCCTRAWNKMKKTHATIILLDDPKAVLLRSAIHQSKHPFYGTLSIHRRECIKLDWFKSKFITFQLFYCPSGWTEMRTRPNEHFQRTGPPSNADLFPRLEGKFRWHRRVSNTGPLDPESYALPLRHTGSLQGCCKMLISRPI